MAGYQNFNFMFLVFNNDFFKTILYEAASLNNFRAMSPIVGEKTFFLQPVTFPNNPFAFSNPSTYSEWSNHFFANDFPVNNPLCFVIYEGYYIPLKAINFFKHLRENYRGCKLVLWVDNPIRICQNIRGMFVNEADTDEILSTFDLVFTYNQKDAIDYGMTYFDGLYSVLPFEQPEQSVDIFFVGRSKDRLEKILRAYETFNAAGFVCEFYISDVYAPPPDSFH